MSSQPKMSRSSVVITYMAMALTAGFAGRSLLRGDYAWSAVLGSLTLFLAGLLREDRKRRRRKDGARPRTVGEGDGE